MQVRSEGFATTPANDGAANPARIAGDLLAGNRSFGGADVPALRDAVSALAERDPALGKQVREEIAKRLSVTDQAEFARATAPVKTQARPQDHRLGVDDHRNASSLSELDRWEAGYRDAVKANGGKFSNSPTIERAFAADRQRLEAATALADKNTNTLIYYSLGAPVLAGAGFAAMTIAGPIAGARFVSPTIGRIASGATSSTIGATTNVALEGSKNAVLGLDHTRGGYVGAAVSGAIGGSGVRLLGARAPEIANNVALGGASGIAGEYLSQYLDTGGQPRGLDKIALSGAVGAGFAAAAPLEVRVNGLNSGRANSVATYEGLQTRAANGDIEQHRLRYAVQAGVGRSLGGTVQGAVGTAVTGVYQKAKNE